jgi:hypothetical protein
MRPPEGGRAIGLTVDDQRVIWKDWNVVILVPGVCTVMLRLPDDPGAPAAKVSGKKTTFEGRLERGQ